MKKLLFMLILMSVAGGTAQDVGKKIYTAHFCDLAAPVIDGRSDDAVWQQADPGQGFTQHEPDNGAPASEKSGFRIVYDADNLYVLIRSHDRQADKLNFLRRFLVMGIWRTPGLELNDLGYMRQADQLIQVFWAQYRTLKPHSILREFYANVNEWQFWNFGGEFIGRGANCNVNLTLTNSWHAGGGISHETRWLGLSALRGGPAIYYPASTNIWYNFSTDDRKTLSFFGSGQNYHNQDGITRFNHYSAGIEVRPSAAFSLSLNPSCSFGTEDLQYVDTIETTRGPRYIMGRIDQKNLAMVVRFDYCLTPELSIQYYGQPFIAAGNYTRFKSVTRPRASVHSDQFETFGGEEIDYDEENNQYAIDEDADGQEDFRFDKPDFNFRQFRSNLVLRWEYRAGSTLFLVWSQGRSNSVEGGRFSYRHDMRELFNVYPDNVFLVKCNYWFSL